MSKQSINEKYIEGLISGKIQESLYLDYKRSEALENTEYCKKEISKDVSAFANSDGGKIIYGVSEKGHIPIEIDNGQPVKGKREWLEQVIKSNIQPRILGVRIYQIDLQSNPDRAIFVVEIPRGFTAHQAKNKRYYKRTEYESSPMFDYEVKQTINRAREPILRLELGEIGPIYLLRQSDNPYALTLTLKNDGLVSAKSVEIFLFIPYELAPESMGAWSKIDDSKMTIQRSGLTTFFLKFKPPYFESIHPRKQIFACSGSINRLVVHTYNYINRNETLEGNFEIYAEDSQPKFGKIRFIFKNSALTMELEETIN